MDEFYPKEWKFLLALDNHSAHIFQETQASLQKNLDGLNLYLHQNMLLGSI